MCRGSFFSARKPVRVPQIPGPPSVRTEISRCVTQRLYKITRARIKTTRRREAARLPEIIREYMSPRKQRFGCFFLAMIRLGTSRARSRERRRATYSTTRGRNTARTNYVCDVYLFFPSFPLASSDFTFLVLHSPYLYLIYRYMFGRIIALFPRTRITKIQQVYDTCLKTR